MQSPEAALTAEADLIARLQRREEGAYAAFVAAHAGRMLATARRYLPSEADAEDAVQDALVSIVRAIGAFAGRSRLSTWAHRIVVNAALMRLRTRSRRPEASQGEAESQLGQRDHIPLPGRPEPRTSWESRDLIAAVHLGLARLPANLRAVVRLRDIEGCGMAGTCEALGLSLSTLKLRLHDGRSRLREVLRPMLGVS